MKKFKEQLTVFGVTILIYHIIHLLIYVVTNKGFTGFIDSMFYTDNYYLDVLVALITIWFVYYHYITLERIKGCEHRYNKDNKQNIEQKQPDNTTNDSSNIHTGGTKIN